MAVVFTPQQSHKMIPDIADFFDHKAERFHTLKTMDSRIHSIELAYVYSKMSLNNCCFDISNKKTTVRLLKSKIENDKSVTMHIIIPIYIFTNVCMVRSSFTRSRRGFAVGSGQSLVGPENETVVEE